jgi:hypothetical protein
MAPIDSPQTPPSGRKPKTVTIEEEDNWEELAPENDLPTTSKAQPRPAVIPPAVASTLRQRAEIQRAQGRPQVPGHPVCSFPPPASQPFGMPPPYPAPPPPQCFPYDSYGAHQSSTRIQQLQNELIEIATIDLGLLNSVRVLEQRLITSAQPAKPRQITPLGVEWRGVPLNNAPLANLSLDRSGALMTIQNMGHLLGLSKAIKLLREALDDPDREDVKYEVNLFTYAPLPNPAMPMGAPPPPMPPTPLTCLKADDVKNIVKEVLKESTSSEESQKEMIKLVRDVCMSSLQRH